MIEGNPTTWVYDGLGRVASRHDAYSLLEERLYDGAGNLAVRKLRDGNEISYTHDAAGQLTGRTYRPLTTGGTIQTTTWDRDGLGRVTEADRGAMTTRWRYDSLGQAVGEDQIVTGTIRTLGFSHDAAGQRDSLLYPSQLGLATTSTALGHIATIGDGAGPLADFDYLGSLLASRQAGPFQWKSIFDASGRLIDRRTTAATGPVLAHESIERNLRGFAQSTTRWDLAGAGWTYSYDEAGRVTQVDAQDADWPGLAGSFHYTVDEAQNLTSILSTGTVSACGEATSTASTIDLGPGNRPAKLTTDGAESILQFDARGNLVAKGDLRFVYDGDNRLIEIRHSDDTVLASYGYDALGRRTQRVTGGRTFHTVWDGWQAIEEIEVVGGQDVVQSRRVYGGAGLDDVVRLEQRLGTALESYFPLYDTIGNLIAVTDEQGEIVERNLYTPYGDRIVWVDDTPPVVEQIRLEDGAVVLELSEPIQPKRVEEVFDSLSATLRRPSDNQYFEVGVETPVTTGRQAHQRVVLSVLDPDNYLTEGDTLRLEIPSTGLLDRFGQATATSFDHTFSWSSTGLTILKDTTPPRVDEICIAADRTLKITLSEPANLASASSALQIDAQTVSWTADPTGYILTSPPLDAGNHSLALQTTALDLAGLGLAAAETHPVTATDGQVATVFSAPGPNLLTESTVGNVLGFHGLPKDPESGLLYVRNRYYDPELGRFITEDPLGYVDGPNLYQFALNNPFAYSDPTGEAVPVLAMCLGAGSASVILGAGIDTAFGDKYTWSDGAIDFAVGALSCGVGSELVAARHLSKAARLGLGAAAEVPLVTGGEMLRSYIDEQELHTANAWMAGGVAGATGLALPIIGSRFTRLTRMRTGSLPPKAELVARLARVLRARALGWNHEQGRFDAVETLGLLRAQEALGRVFRASFEEGIDALDPQGLGRISLKGPFLNKQLQALDRAYQELAVRNLEKHISRNTAVDVHIIDTLGLDEDITAELMRSMRNPNFAKIIYLISKESI